MATALEFTSFPNATGPIEFAWVSWDSEPLGFPVYELRLKPDQHGEWEAALASWLPTLTDSAMVTCKITDDSASAVLHRQRFFLAEANLLLQLDLEQLVSLSLQADSAGCLREASAADLSKLTEILISSMRTDRFHSDPWIPNELADQRMQQWIARSFAAQNVILVYQEQEQNQIVGFVDFRPIDPKTTYVSLAAVHPDYQASGLVLPMFDAVFNEWTRRGFRTAVASVSGNNPASFNLASALGFRAYSFAYTYQWHATQPDSNNDRPVPVDRDVQV